MTEKKASEWIKESFEHVEECNLVFLSQTPQRKACGCVLGGAYYYKNKDTIPLSEMFATMQLHAPWLGFQIGLPPQISEEVSDMHHRGKSREECLAYVEQQGY